jgi:DNA-nicking Smr family endonuclease
MHDDHTSPNPVRIPIEPELDLHAFHPRDIPSVVEEYVHAARAAGFREIRLVHGRGRGVQRGIVQATLERHPLVDEFWDDSRSHLGATVARLVSQEPPGGHPG